MGRTRSESPVYTSVPHRARSLTGIRLHAGVAHIAHRGCGMGRRDREWQRYVARCTCTSRLDRFKVVKMGAGSRLPGAGALDGEGGSGTGLGLRVLLSDEVLCLDEDLDGRVEVACDAPALQRHVRCVLDDLLSSPVHTHTPGPAAEPACRSQAGGRWRGGDVPTRRIWRGGDRQTDAS